MMYEDALTVLKSRRSVRSYKEEQITTEELMAVLEAGTYAPTATGTQGVKIIAVQTPKHVAAVNRLNGLILSNNPNAVPYYGAPTVLLIFATNKSVTPELDTAAVCTNLVNAAYAVGLGSCWVHRCKEMFALEEGKELLKAWGIEEPLTGFASIALGYAAKEAPVAPARREGYFNIV